MDDDVRVPDECDSNNRDLSRLETAELIRRIDELLEVTYRSEDLGNIDDVLSETVYILLSLSTRESVYQRVFARLRQTYPRWLDVLGAETSELERVLRPGGLQSQKSGHLQALLKVVLADNLRRGAGPADDQGDLTLEYLREMADDEAESFLLALPGVGKKTARCVLAYALNRQVFAVDTHVTRIFDRLGLLAQQDKPAHDLYQAVVPPPARKRLHINLIHHGRAVCRSRAKCETCVLVSFCASGQQQVARDTSRPVAVDLFAGAGGLGYGFRRAGWRVAVAVERDRDAAQTYRANNPGTPVLEADVAKTTAADLQTVSPGLSAAAVLAGPPCQGYSAAGARNPDDPQNRLYEHVVRIADALSAPLIVLENVPGLRRVNGVGFSEEILSALDHSRSAEHYELVASDFGVPQARKRLFFLALDSPGNSGVGSPQPTHSLVPNDGLSETPTLESVLRGPLEVPSGAGEDIIALADGALLSNCATMRHSERVIEKIEKIAPGKGPISYRRLQRDLARTLVAGHRALPVHPWLHRTISVREAARIQGFPDTYTFCGPRANQPLQVANAVPPPVAEAMARHLQALVAVAAPKPTEGAFQTTPSP